jgi:hypothetical protein
MEKLPEVQLRVSTRERETAISRLQEAYIRGQLSDHELGERIDRALTAVVAADLSALVGDLPAFTTPVQVAAVRSPWWRRKGENQSVYKSTVRKNGAWTVPPVFRSHVYKGMLVLDLRQAVLSADETVIQLNVYKSRVAILVPPEYGVVLDGTAYKGTMENLTTGGVAGAPTILVRGSAYKSSVVVTDRDPEAPGP